MIVCNSLLILPRHSNKVGIVISDDLQGQEIMKLNNKSFNTIYNIKDAIRAEGFIFEASGQQGQSKWYLKTKDNRYSILVQYTKRFNTSYLLDEFEHYWLCPNCTSAVPDTWTKCTRCK